MRRRARRRAPAWKPSSALPRRLFRPAPDQRLAPRRSRSSSVSPGSAALRSLVSSAVAWLPAASWRYGFVGSVAGEPRGVAGLAPGGSSALALRCWFIVLPLVLAGIETCKARATCAEMPGGGGRAGPPGAGKVCGKVGEDRVIFAD